VRDFGKVVKALGTGRGVEVGCGDPLTFEFDETDLVEECGGKVRPHASLVLIAERLSGGKIVAALLAQIVRDLADRLDNVVTGKKQRRLGILGGWRETPLQGRIEVVELGGGLGGFAEDVLTSKAGEIAHRVVKAELISGTMRAEQLEVRLMEFRVQLNGDPIIGVQVRTHGYYS
jgi:hypothetical protein